MAVPADGVGLRAGQAYDVRARALANRVLGEPARLGRTRLVAVDGPAGSGKTSLAAELEREGRGLFGQVATVHLDDLYEGWDGLNESLERRVLDQILLPLAAGRAGRWQRYDWVAGRFAEWRDQPVPDVLVLEGCGSGARAFAPYTTLVVWLEADAETRIARGVARDGQAALGHWLVWMDAEAAHFAANATRRRADVRYRTD